MKSGVYDKFVEIPESALFVGRLRKERLCLWLANTSFPLNQFKKLLLFYYFLLYFFRKPFLNPRIFFKIILLSDGKYRNDEKTKEEEEEEELKNKFIYL